MAEYPQEGVLRGGHVAGAKNVPWRTAAKDDGTFKSREELEKIYQEELGYKPDGDTIVYLSAPARLCRAERLLFGGKCHPTRHNPVPGIMPIMPLPA
jgi:hypothetical protein